MPRRSPAAASLDATMQIVILRGPDRFLRDRYTQMLVDTLTAAHGEIEQFAFDGSTTEPAVILDELRSYGLLQQHKLVIVDDADKLLVAKDDAEEGPSHPRMKSPRALFERYAGTPVDSATLLLRASTWRPGRLDKAVQKVGTSIKCDTPSSSDAASWCLRRCPKEHGAEISGEAAQMLVERVGSDLARLDVELQKLAAYVGEGTAIDAEAVRVMVGLSREEQAWVIQAALLTGRPADAVAQLRRLVEISRQPEQPIMWAMTDLLRKLHAAARLTTSGMPAGAVAKQVRLWGPGGNQTVARASAIGAARLSEMLDRSIDTDRRLKSGFGRASRTLEALAAQIADTMGAAARR